MHDSVFGWTYNNKALDMQLSYDYIIPSYMEKVFLILQNRIGSSQYRAAPQKHSIARVQFCSIKAQHL